MAELVFSVKDIFLNKDTNNCLVQYDNAECYHIPAYQRGYKWGSDDNGAVTVLLKDLKEAFLVFQKGERKEYYLQYITVKKVDKYLEVIDGQQRLTTLSIILSIFAHKLNEENIALNKLDYAVRSNFFQEFIYDKNKLEELLLQNWQTFSKHEQYDKQDIYYLFHAACRVDRFLKKEIKKDDLDEFYQFILNNVIIIINAVEKHILSETVFRNLNSNKVPLTESELIKGLLITKVGRTFNVKKHFKEILEIRMKIGRHWDEISRWANSPEISRFFFNDKDGMESLLRLVAIIDKEDRKVYTKTSGEHPLFNYYHRQSNFNEIYQDLKDTYQVLKDIYHNDVLYNLLGFCRFSRGNKHNNLDFLKDCISKNKSELLDFLTSKRNELIPRDTLNLSYGEDNDDIHRVLLALSVFSDVDIKFNFHEFIEKKWSLEHIFSQSPEGKKLILTDSQKSEIIKILGESITPEVEAILQKEERSEDEKQIYYEALKSIGGLDTIGNMCLLTSGDNSSNSCELFEAKRNNILNFIRKGSFVPKHTFDIFSKIILKEGGELSQWTNDNIEEHKTYIQNTITQLLK